jgi:hypothetical protein
MNPKIAAFALAIGIIVVIPVAAQTPEPTQPGSWVLLALDVFNGAVSPRTALPNLPKPETGEGLPTFHTRAACERALRETIKFYAYPGHVHANGAFGFYLCTDYETWKHELIGPSGGK